MAPQAFEEVSSLCWFLPLQTSILLCCWLPSLLCVLVGEFLAVWLCNADCAWNQLSNSFLDSLTSCSLLTTSCSSAAWCWRSSTWAHLWHTGLLPVPATEKSYRHFLQSEVCTAASTFTRSFWGKVSSTDELDDSDAPARATVFCGTDPYWSSS